MKIIEVAPYNPDWPLVFEAEDFYRKLGLAEMEFDDVSISERLLI